MGSSAGKLLFFCLIAVGCRGGDDCGPSLTAPIGSPPSQSTHHAIVAGVVTGANDQPLSGISVGGRYAPGCRSVSVTGGGMTDAWGAYQVELQMIHPSTQTEADVFVHAFRYGTSGSPLVTDSVRITLVSVPLAEPPSVHPVPPLRLPIQ